MLLEVSLTLLKASFIKFIVKVSPTIVINNHNMFTVQATGYVLQL
jgi:hypothetical protein